MLDCIVAPYPITAAPPPATARPTYSALAPPSLASFWKYPFSVISVLVVMRMYASLPDGREIPHHQAVFLFHVNPPLRSPLVSKRSELALLTSALNQPPFMLPVPTSEYPRRA